MQISAFDTSNLIFGCDFWGENANSWHSRLIHTQNGGIIRLRDPLKLIYSIRLKQKSNPEPLNPEPVNGYEALYHRLATGRAGTSKSSLASLQE